MDILKFKPVDTVSVAIKAPDVSEDDFDIVVETDIAIVVYGTHTRQWRKALSQHNPNEDGSGAKLLAAATASWSGVSEDGTELEPTPENIERVYREYPWIMTQVDVAIGEKQRFFPNAGLHSASTPNS